MPWFLSVTNIFRRLSTKTSSDCVTSRPLKKPLASGIVM